MSVYEPKPGTLREAVLVMVRKGHSNAQIRAAYPQVPSCTMNPTLMRMRRIADMPNETATEPDVEDVMEVQVSAKSRIIALSGAGKNLVEIRRALPELDRKYISAIVREHRHVVPEREEAPLGPPVEVAEIRRLLSKHVPITAIAAKLHVPYRAVIAVADGVAAR